MDARYFVARVLGHSAMGFWFSFAVALCIWMIWLNKHSAVEMPPTENLLSLINRLMFAPLLAGLVGSLANNLIDLDHLLTWSGLAGIRPLHVYFFIIGIVGALFFSLKITWLFAKFNLPRKSIFVPHLLGLIVSLSFVLHVAEDWLLDWW